MEATTGVRNIPIDDNNTRTIGAIRYRQTTRVVQYMKRELMYIVDIDRGRDHGRRSIVDVVEIDRGHTEIVDKDRGCRPSRGFV